MLMLRDPRMNTQYEVYFNFTLAVLASPRPVPFPLFRKKVFVMRKLLHSANSTNNSTPAIARTCVMFSYCLVSSPLLTYLTIKQKETKTQFYVQFLKSRCEICFGELEKNKNSLTNKLRVTKSAYVEGGLLSLLTNEVI